MSEKSKQLREIELTQTALRDSIEESKRLADKAQQLLERHKRFIEAAENS